MKNAQASRNTDRFCVSLPPAVGAWIRRRVAKTPGATVSALVLSALLPLFDKRHAK